MTLRPAAGRAVVAEALQPREQLALVLERA
jgi:hypothetical protein